MSSEAVGIDISETDAETNDHGVVVPRDIVVAGHIDY